MGQLNVRTTPEFEDDLRALMERWKIASRSEAIRRAVATCRRLPPPVDWRDLVGILKDRPTGVRITEDELWGDA